MTGVGNYVRRSMTEVESTQTISVFGDVIRLEMKCGDKQHVKLEFRLNEEFQIDAGQPSLARACWEHGALVLTVRRLGCRRLQVIERRLVGDRLVQTMRCNNVTCTRVMRRMQTT
ncbi:uncharacterized protein LOC127865890 isoform X2 [Dreissena polymorpha]|uniref:uncharacterized protein LOC127865890 isoform X2 n=1 Tax=Dreissena polymorpha TaxID=45954 RepID=UPI002264B987|nr:uncharacterized protein LOC127865890 isoform X2 [Dreissena polymorpha]